MNDRETLLQTLDQMVAELRSLHMAQTVQRSAYLVLVRHLAAQGLAQPETLMADLQTMGETQTEPGWRSGHAEIANALQLVHELTSARPK